jgi:hypothetical protein
LCRKLRQSSRQLSLSVTINQINSSFISHYHPALSNINSNIIGSSSHDYTNAGIHQSDCIWTGQWSAEWFNRPSDCRMIRQDFITICDSLDHIITQRIYYNILIIRKLADTAINEERKQKILLEQTSTQRIWKNFVDLMKSWFRIIFNFFESPVSQFGIVVFAIYTSYRMQTLEEKLTKKIVEIAYVFHKL